MSSSSSSSLGEQFLTSSSMVEKLSLAISVLRNQPNRWFSLTLLDQEIGCGVLMVRFPITWREYLLKHNSTESSSSIKCRYMIEKKKVQQQDSSSVSPHKKQLPVNPSQFELKYSAPFFRDTQDLMKQLSTIYSSRNSRAATKDNNYKDNNKDSSSSNNNNSSSRGLAIESLAAGESRPRSLQIVQQAVDRDWLYVVPSHKPSKKTIMMLNSGNADDADGDFASLVSGFNEDGSVKLAPRRRQRTRKDNEGDATDNNVGQGGGAILNNNNQESGGGGGGSGGSYISSSSFQENLLGGESMCRKLRDEQFMDVFISTRILNSLVIHPKGNFLPNVMNIPANGPQLNLPPQTEEQERMSEQDLLLHNLKRLQDGYWDVNITKELNKQLPIGSKRETRISVVCEPARCYIWPPQAVIQEENKSSSNNLINSSSSSPTPQFWKGLFRIVPLQEGRVEFKINITTLTSGDDTNNHNNRNGQENNTMMNRTTTTASSTTTTSSNLNSKQDTYSHFGMIKKRFPVDDQAIARAPPILFYRGIGSKSILPALGLDEDHQQKASNNRNNNSKNNQPSSSSFDGKLVATSVKRMLEPAAAIMQSVEVGAVVSTSNRIASLIKPEDLKFAEDFCFISSQLHSNIHQNNSNKSAIQLEREAKMKARLQRLENQDNNNDANKKNAASSSSRANARKDLKFCNAHMLHLGIDTRKPYFQDANGGDGFDKVPLESMDV